MNKMPHAMSMYWFIPAGTPMYPVKTIHTFQNSYGDVDNNSPRRIVPFNNGLDWWGDWVRHTTALLASSGRIDYDTYWDIHLKHSKKEIFLSPTEVLTPVYNIIPPYDQQFYFIPLDHPMWYGYLVERSLVKIFNGSSI